MIPLLVLLAVVPFVLQGSARAGECASAPDCRDLALAAAAAGDVERFHDLAWRAAQRGPKNDPDLMALVARAQSLSGRPHDALVMLQRLAAMGVRTDAAESSDFARVRALPGWAELERRLASLPADAPAAGVMPPLGPTPASAAAPPHRGAPPATPSVRTLSALPPAVGRPGAGLPDAPTRKPASGGRGEDVLRFTTPPFQPAGLAYDAVSSRFIVGNRDGHRVSVVGERSSRLVTLSGADSGGFGEVTAVAIDVREGDLWVASTAAAAAPGATLHKLQLISGRVLATIPVPVAEGTGARVTDLVATDDGDLVALDAASRRLLRIEPRGRDLQVIAMLEHQAVSVAPARAMMYVALADGIAMLDSATGLVTTMRAKGNSALGGFEVLRWRRGSLIGIQRANGVRQLVRIVLDAAGRTALKSEVLDRPESIAPHAALAIAGDAAYYLAERPSSASEREMVVRRVLLK